MSIVLRQGRCLGCGKYVHEGVERCDKCIARVVSTVVESRLLAPSRLTLRDVRPADITEPWTL
jgi:hypothetical protein